MRQYFNTLGPKQNGRYWADDIFKCIFFNENVWISLQISLKFVPKIPHNNIPALVQVMDWHRPGDQWVKDNPTITFVYAVEREFLLEMEQKG